MQSSVAQEFVKVGARVEAPVPGAVDKHRRVHRLHDDPLSEDGLLVLLGPRNSRVMTTLMFTSGMLRVCFADCLSQVGSF